MRFHNGKVNMEPWIETFSGKKYYFDRKNPENICIEDIASALSKVCRFSGHCKEFYSVAEHSIKCSMLVPEAYQLAALLHDASEAYIADIPSPAKQLLPEYKQLEERIMQDVATAFGLPTNFHNSPDVKLADWAQLKTEAKYLLPSGGAEWYFPDNIPRGLKPLCNYPKRAEELFLERYYTIIRSNNGNTTRCACECKSHHGCN